MRTGRNIGNIVGNIGGNIGTDGTFRNNRERRFIRSANIFQQSPGVCVSIAEHGMRQKIGNVNVLPDSLAWDAMIRDAKKRIEELKLSIELFEKKKAAGERWPPVQSQDQGAAQQNSIQGITQFPAS